MFCWKKKWKILMKFYLIFFSEINFYVSQNFNMFFLVTNKTVSHTEVSLWEGFSLIRDFLRIFLWINSEILGNNLESGIGGP